MTLDQATELDEGGLWELGVAFPISNPKMERFEQFFQLTQDTTLNFGAIIIDSVYTSKFKKNDLVFIGPSSDPTRVSGVLQYYGKSEFFRVYSIYENTVYLTSYDTGFPTAPQNIYLKGDSITLRSIANSWDYLANAEFADTVVNAIGKFSLERNDSVDDFKNFSQGVKVIKYPVSTNHSGIVQKIQDARRSLLIRITQKNIRMSSWMRIYTRIEDTTIGNDIDENTAGEVEGNAIDEGVGNLIDKSAFGNAIDENVGDSTGSSGYVIPSIRMGFYDDVALSSLISDSEEKILGIKVSTRSFFLNKIVQVPAKTMSAKIAAFAQFPSVPGLQDTVLLVDDVLAEHCVGTSKEDDGYYKVDMNPDLNPSTMNMTTVKVSKGILGTKRRIGVGDPNSRYKIEADWGNRPGYFIDDLRVLEAWNKEGYPIVLRTKMPNTLPVTLLCNMEVKSKFIRGSLGTAKADVSVTFEEVAT